MASKLFDAHVIKSLCEECLSYITSKMQERDEQVALNAERARLLDEIVKEQMAKDREENAKLKGAFLSSLLSYKLRNREQIIKDLNLSHLLPVSVNVVCSGDISFFKNLLCLLSFPAHTNVVELDANDMRIIWYWKEQIESSNKASS